jgi:hypothetical protein
MYILPPQHPPPLPRRDRKGWKKGDHFNNLASFEAILLQEAGLASLLPHLTGPHLQLEKLCIAANHLVWPHLEAVQRWHLA